jgi:dihydropteroate synthase
MEKAARLGVRMINNVAGLAPVSVLRTLGGIPGMRYVAMHMHGTPLSMQQHPLEPPEAEALVGAFFEKAHEALLSAGFAREHIYLDAGIGFGKTDAANVRLLGLTHKWAGKWQIAVGLSRKSWIGRALEIASPEERDTPSKMLELAQMQAGARLIRTHDTKTLARLRNLMYDIR